MNVLRAIVSLFRETAVNWSRDKASMLAAGLAYYAVFSLAPLLVISIAVVGLVFGEAAAQKEIVAQIAGIVGQEIAETIQLIILNASQNASGAVATVLSIGLLLVGASGVFNHLKRALDTIWGIQPGPNNGLFAFIKNRVFSFGMVLLIGFLLLVSLVSQTILAALTSSLSAYFPMVGELSRLEFVTSFVMVTLLFAIIFKGLPDVEVAWRDVGLGAVVTSLLFAVGEYLIGWYLSRGVDSPYGAAGSLIVLLLWIYYSAQILLFGAEFTQVYANRYGSRLRPSENATFTNGNPLYEPVREYQVEPTPRVMEPAGPPQNFLLRQIGAGLLGLAVGLLLAFIAGLRRHAD